MSSSSDNEGDNEIALGDRGEERLPCALLEMTASNEIEGDASAEVPRWRVPKQETALPPFPPSYATAAEPLRAKEVVLVCMALLLLVASVLLFFKHWKKNYRDINQLPYYAYLYQKDGSADFGVAPPAPPPPPPGALPVAPATEESISVTPIGSRLPPAAKTSLQVRMKLFILILYLWAISSMMDEDNFLE